MSSLRTMDFFVIFVTITPRLSRSGLVPDSGQIPLPICLSPRRTVNPRWLRNFARERRRELLELEQKDTRADAKPRSAARRGVGRTNYRKITRQSILSSVARTKKAGRGTGRKFTSKDLAGAPPPLPPPPPLDAVAGPPPRMA